MSDRSQMELQGSADFQQQTTNRSGGGAGAGAKNQQRQASSCTECRRRKQKCSQGQPCTNCARRFPQPICDYTSRTKSRRKPGKTLDAATTHAISREGPYSHLNHAVNHAGVLDAILQVERDDPSSSSKAAFSIRSRPRNSPPDWIHEDDGEELAPIYPASASANGSVSGLEPDRPRYYTEADRFIGHFRNWLPFRLAIKGKTGASKKQSLMGALAEIMDSRREGVDGGGVWQGMAVDEEWVLDAARLVWAAEGKPQPSVSLGRMDDEMRHLPMPLTRLNKELVRTHLKLLSRFKASVGGSPSPDNPFMKHWIPFIIQDPLLINTVLFTSACFLNETGHLPKAIVVALRGMVYQALNQNLRSGQSSAQIGDAAVLAVSEMVLMEWYWGATHELYAHLNGLKTMIRLRGGLKELGMHGYLAKLILIHDAAMALCHETVPEMYGTPGFEFSDPVQTPFQNSLSSPLAFGWPSFASCAAGLYLHPGTATILDDVRAMFHAVVSLPGEEEGGATAEQTARVMDVAQWVYTRLGEMPDNVLMQPSLRSPPPAGSSPSSSSSSSPSAGGSSSNGGRSPGQSSSTSPGSLASGGKREGTVARMEEFPDPVYRMVRMTAVIYCRAILSRVPTSMVCSDNEFIQIWLLSWRIPMAARRSLVGIFMWVLLVLAPSCHQKATARFIKSLVVNSIMTVAVENWQVAIEICESGLRLQRWLANGRRVAAAGGAGLTLSGGEGMIEKHGFAQKEVLKNISRIHLGDDNDDDDNDDTHDRNGNDNDRYDDEGRMVEDDDDLEAEGVLVESYKEDLMAR